MIQTIGLIVAVYAMARLLQVPLEFPVKSRLLSADARHTLTLVISLCAALGVGMLTMLLLTSPAPVPR